MGEVARAEIVSKLKGGRENMGNTAQSSLISIKIFAANSQRGILGPKGLIGHRQLGGQQFITKDVRAVFSNVYCFLCMVT